MKKITLSLILLFSLITNAQLNVNNTLYSPADLILSKLIGPGVTVSNVKYNGSAASALITNNQLGFYTTGTTPTNLGLASGLLMTNGSATGAIGPNNTGANTTTPAFAQFNDPDLLQIAGQSINHICILEFDFIPQGPEVKFEYVFASEEYPEFVGTTFNDVFGFFLSGPGVSGPYSNGAKNIALLPNGITPISINNVNPGLNSSYYVSNAGGATIQYDGFTTVLTAKSEVQCGQTYHIKLAIADVGDPSYDSAVFLKEGSFSVPEINLGGDMVGPASACCGQKLLFSTPFSPANYPGVVHDWYFNGALVYSTTTSNVFDFDNPTCTNGVLKVVVKPYPSQNCTFEKSKIINYQFGPTLNIPPPLTLCSDTPATATGSFDLNMQINNIITNFDSDYEELGFFNTKDDAVANINGIPAATWHNFTGVDNQSVFLGVSNLVLTGNICRSVMEFKLKFVNCDDVVCSPNPSSAVFDLTTRKPIILNGFDPTKYSISFHHDMPSAVAGTAPIIPQNSYTLTSNPEEIYVRYWENAVPLNKQFTQFSLQANQSNFAGSDGNLTFCMTDTAVFNLFDYITGEQNGGTWTIASGSGANLDLTAGTISSNNVAANYVLKYTVNSSLNCPADFSLLNITINPVCGMQTPPDMFLCDDSSNDGVEIFNLSSQNAAILGSLSSADYTISYHVSSADAISGAFPITPNNAYPNISNPQTIYIRAVKNADNSAFDTGKSFKLHVNEQPFAGTDGSTTVCETSTVVIDLYSLITGEHAGGTWSLSSGSGGTFDAVAGTFTPAIGATTSVFDYTLTGTLPCVNDSSVATVIINKQPVAGTDGNTTVCETSTDIIDLYSLITNEEAGGAWVLTSGSGGTFNAAAGTFTPAVGATTSTFTYTLLGTLPCLNDSSVATVNINAQPIAGTNGSITVCETDTVVIDLYSLITGEQAGGAWTQATGSGGTFNQAAGTFTSAAGATTSTFTYTLAGVMPCAPVSSVATVNINAQPTAGTDGVVTVCTNGTTTIDLYSLITGEQAGGSWAQTSGSGGTFNAAAGTFTPAAGATNSTFEYTLLGIFPCVNDSSVATVNFSAQPDAGADGSIAICDNSTTTINLYSLITGEQAGGAWSQTSGSGGVFNAAAGTFTPAVGATTSTFAYTLSATLPCVNDSSIATVTISSIPTNISITGSATTCAGIPVNLTVTATPGTVITWTGSPSSFTILPSGSNVISVSPTVLTTYALTSASLNGCTIPVLGQSATVTVSTTPQFITQIPDITICNGGPLNIASQLTSTVPGATFIWSATTSNVNMAVISGDETNIDQIVNLINTLQNGTVNIEVKPQIGSCSGASQQILVTVKPIPVITSTVTNKAVICNNEFVTLTSNSNPVATIYNWQINTATGVQIVGGATNGTSTTGIVNLQLALTNPLVAGTISFDFTPVNGICTGATVPNAVTITVNPIPGTPIGLPTDEICSGETTNLTISSFPNITGTMLEWTVVDSQNVTGFTNGTGAAPFAINDVLTNTSNVQGYVKYSVTSKLGTCEGGTTEYTVLVNPLPKPNLLDGHICANQSTGVTYQSYILDAQLSNPDFTYDWYVLNTTTNVYDALPSTNGPIYEATIPGTYQVIVTNTVTNCEQTDQATVITVYPATAFTTVVTDAFTNDATITVTVNPIGTGNLIYSLDGGAWQSSNVFTGVEAGSHEVMVEDLEGCTNLTETVEVIDYPKYFTPNGDGFNDKWKIVGLEAKHNAKIYIFDRYGKLIKQIDPLGEGWDGKYNGQDIPSTDYWFNVDYTENNQQKQFKAHFSLKR